MTRRNADAGLLRALRSVGRDFIAASELASQAGWPVAELGSRIELLRAAGYDIEENARGGYRLISAPERLIADDLMASLPPQPLIGREILVFEETGSTNDLAAKAGEDGAAEGLVIFAESQHAGRGRLGRVWNSPPHQGLWFSILLRPGEPAERWPELTFCTALAVAEAAECETGVAARIKWPNDVLIKGRKVAGILLECHHRRKPGFVVVGIGVNIRQQEADFAPELRARAESLSMAAQKPIERRRAAAEILRRFERIYLDWPQRFDAIIRGCEERGCLPDEAKEKADRVADRLSS